MEKRKRRSAPGTFIRLKFNVKNKLDRLTYGKESYSETINRLITNRKTRWL
jgi:predicted CopG family antitoxin